MELIVSQLSPRVNMKMRILQFYMSDVILGSPCKEGEKMASMNLWVFLALAVALAELTFLAADKIVRLFLLYREAARLDGNRRRNLRQRLDAGTDTAGDRDESRSLGKGGFLSRLAYAYNLGMRG